MKFPNQSAIKIFAGNCCGIIKNDLKKKGRPIPENGIWIAALSKEYQLILVTRDDHFNEIEDLSVERW